jgi:2-polyprenyl-6-methoxyphenol hydroxylase-like FAD-dependent oxidoreductase
LANELRLGGVPTVVLERAAERPPHFKALGIHARTVEVLAMRKLDAAVTANARAIPNWHFGMLHSRLDFSDLDTPFPFVLAYPQKELEALFEQRARDLGAEIRRGHTVTDAVDKGHHVEARIEGPDGEYTEDYPYIVGCDGAGSTVRRLAGIDFVGTDAASFGYLADVALDDPPAQAGYNRNSIEGALLITPIPGGLYRVAGFDPKRQSASATPMTLDDVRDSVTRVAGTDFGMRDPIWLSRFGDASRQAETYRRGRFLLAGDAAHMHFPAGGVGLNVGVQDAMNLGWKLAADLRGQAPNGLLDSYQLERHPVGASLLEHTLAQTSLIAASTPQGIAMRSLFSDLIATHPNLSRTLARRLAGLDVSYPPSGARVADPRVFTLLHRGRPVLINDSGVPIPMAERAAAERAIDVHRDVGDGSGMTLVRPDGHVWWTSDEPDDEATAEVVSALFQPR